MAHKQLKRGTVLVGGKSQYAVTHELDRGGVGAVYKGKNIQNGEAVALKVLHGGRFEISDIARLRFRAEIAKSLNLRHPNLVQTIDYGMHGDEGFLVLEYLSGGTLAQCITMKNYNETQALTWIIEILEAIFFIHESGLVHRDLKPNNMLLDESGVLKIADFGILKDVGEEAYLTLSGDQIGSVLYISPSQRADPEGATNIDDYYAICCCIYEILSSSRIHVAPTNLRSSRTINVPDYVCDVVMDGIRSGGTACTLRNLRECFVKSDRGIGRISDFAASDVLN